MHINFYYQSSGRNKRNFIVGLEDEIGEWIEEENQVGDMLISYYSGSFHLQILCFLILW